MEEEEESEEVIPFKYSITSYGADYPADGLVKRITANSVFIPPFQRAYVWNIAQASRFIESLLLGLPVPGIFLSREEETQKMLVIDGQQRLRTLKYFYDGVFADSGKEFALRGVQEQFLGKTYRTLNEEDRRHLDDSIIHATIVKQEQPSDDDSSIYFIFERLNTGGTLLTSQEIRACIFHGELNDYLREINRNQSWREIYGKIHPRMRDQELILRFLALYFYGDNYVKPLKGFLNTYMGKNRHLKLQTKEEIQKVFDPTVSTIRKAIGVSAFRPQKTLNAAVFDAVMVGVARRLETGEILNHSILKERYDALMNTGPFQFASARATANTESVKLRLELAINAFADVP